MVEAGLVSLDESSAPSGVNRLGEPVDIANVVLFLASDESKFINGTEIVVDNSMSVTAGFVGDG